MRMKNNLLKMAPIVAALGFTGVPLAHAETDCTQVTQIPQAECEALLDLYHSTDGTDWWDNDGWNETDAPCDWYGVSCEGEHVTGLSFESNGLSGAIPESFGNLSSLESLDLPGNRLINLPESFGNLSNLSSLKMRNNQLDSLPYSFGNLSNLSSLDLSGNGLTSLPDSFGDLSNLSSLDLHFNELTSLPYSFGNLSRLESLNLLFNQLTYLPNSFGNLSSLKSLDLLSNQLTSLPESFGDLDSLSTLSLSSNQLISLPESFGNLSSLSILYLSNNQLINLPESFGSLGNLSSLDLHSNQLELLPESFGNLDSLLILYLSYNQLTSLPNSFDNLSSLESLHLDKNPLSVPEFLVSFSKLSLLGLDHNQLINLSESLENFLRNLPLKKLKANLYNDQLTSWPEYLDKYLSNLQSLNLSNNQLTSVPEYIGNLSNLDWFSLSNNQLTSLPESIGNLSRLEWFSLSNNQVTSLPESFGNFSRLRDIELSSNQLTSLPESFGNFSNLENLYLSNNQLTSLPESFGNFNNLWNLDLSSNQLCDLPLSITNLNPFGFDTSFVNNHLIISDPDLIYWLNGVDWEWESSQTPSWVCANLQPDPSSHDFGQLENNQQAHQLFTITNTSDDISIHINTVTITGNQAAEFTQSTNVNYQCTDKTLAAGDVCYEYISLIPNGEGEKQAQLTVSSDDPMISEFHIGLSAIVDNPDVTRADKACLAETPTLQTIDSGLWGDNVWGDMDGNPVSDLPSENDVLLINQGHTIIGLAKAKIRALCNKGKLRSAVGEPLEIIASNGISNHGTIKGEAGQSYPETNCGMPGSDVILKAGTSFYKPGGWRWYGNGKPIYNNGMIKAGDGGDGEDCGGKGGDAIVLGRNTTNDYSGVIFAGDGGNASLLNLS